METIPQANVAHQNRHRGAALDAEALADLLRRNLRGEVRFDAGSRALYATDGSNYRQVPIGVVIPAASTMSSRPLPPLADLAPPCCPVGVALVAIPSFTDATTASLSPYGLPHSPGVISQSDATRPSAGCPMASGIVLENGEEEG
jgi:hypothetical protein